MRVIIEREECTSCAACWEEYPEIFEEDEADGTARIIAKLRTVEGDPGTGEVPVELDDAARAAADECPAEVIRVEE
jgi:ferredoxin